MIPFADAAYYRLRPKLAIKRERVIQADERLGFNAALEPLMPWWRRCRMAVVLGVGYPRPNLSHFRSVEIWETASETEEYLDSGWVARLFAERPRTDALAADGIVLGRNQVGPLFGPGFRSVSLNNPEQAVKQAKRMKDLARAAPNPALAHVVRVQNDVRRAAQRILEKGVDTIDPGASFAATPFGRQLETAARLLRAGVAAPVIKVSIGSFDTHANQARNHQVLLEQLAPGLAAFAQSMETAGLWDRVLVMTYSEFDRRAGENGSAGTDHGTAAPHLMMGAESAAASMEINRRWTGSATETSSTGSIFEASMRPSRASGGGLRRRRSRNGVWAASAERVGASRHRAVHELGQRLPTLALGNQAAHAVRRRDHDAPGVRPPGRKDLEHGAVRLQAHGHGNLGVAFPQLVDRERARAALELRRRRLGVGRGSHHGKRTQACQQDRRDAFHGLNSGCGRGRRLRSRAPNPP